MVEALPVSSKLLSSKLQTRMGTIEILSYAFSRQKCGAILTMLSKKSKAFYDNNLVDFEAMCAGVRATQFWGKSQAGKFDKLQLHPTAIKQDEERG